MKDYGEEPSQISRYNEAGLQIMRLNQLWLNAESYANQGKLILWKFTLDSIWRELNADVLKLEDSRKKQIRNYMLKKDIALCKKNSLLYDALAERHEFLKEIQDLVGKGGIYVDRDSEDFE